MPELKPVLGYPSRTAAAMSLRATGLSPADIGRKIGGKSSNIAKLLSSRARSSVRIPSDVLDDLQPHARRRGISAPMLAVKLLSVIVDDEMVDAILDDA